MHPITSNLHTCAKKILALGYFINIVPAVKPRIEFQFLHTHPHTHTHTTWELTFGAHVFKSQPQQWFSYFWSTFCTETYRLCLYVSFVNSPISSDYRSESVETKETMRLRGEQLAAAGNKRPVQRLHIACDPFLPSFLRLVRRKPPSFSSHKPPSGRCRSSTPERIGCNAHFHPPPTALSFPSLTNRLSRMLFIHFRDLTVRPNGYVNLDSLWSILSSTSGPQISSSITRAHQLSFSWSWFV
jgi:hypothetical protein